MGLRSLLHNFLRREAPPLRGKPERPRIKAYASAQGFAFTYLYEGYREMAGGGGWEFWFLVSAGRDARKLLKIQLEEALVHGWKLEPKERYGIAKLALLAVLDRCGSAEAVPGEYTISAEEASESARELGFID